MREDGWRELGKALMDTAKYLATVGLIGGILTKTITPIGGLVVALIVIAMGAVAFYILPKKEEGK